jgi:hypothetical protein
MIPRGGRTGQADSARSNVTSRERANRTAQPKLRRLRVGPGALLDNADRVNLAAAGHIGARVRAWRNNAVLAFAGAGFDRELIKARSNLLSVELDQISFRSARRVEYAPSCGPELAGAALLPKPYKLVFSDGSPFGRVDREHHGKGGLSFSSLTLDMAVNIPFDKTLGRNALHESARFEVHDLWHKGDPIAGSVSVVDTNLVDPLRQCRAGCCCRRRSGRSADADALVTRAVTTLPLTPAALSATRPSVDVSNPPGADPLIAAITTSSDNPAFTILMTPSLFSVCAESIEASTRKNPARIVFLMTSTYLSRQSLE